MTTGQNGRHATMAKRTLLSAWCALLTVTTMTVALGKMPPWWACAAAATVGALPLNLWLLTRAPS